MSPSSTHREMLKSTGIIAGASFISLGIRMVRVKVFAILLGPAGVGIEGLYDSIISLARTIFGLGLSNSGVRQVAESRGQNDPVRIAITTVTLRRLSLFLGILGTLAVAGLAVPISRMTFGTPDYSLSVVVVSLAVLFGIVNQGQAALIQGCRRLGDLSRIQVYGALRSAVISIPFIWIWGQAGIPASLVALAGVSLLTSWWYARRIHVEPIHVPWRAMRSEVRQLAAWGAVFLATAAITTASLYFSRIIVGRNFDLAGVGIFNAASTISTVYIGFVISAMGTEFYPRLTGLSNDPAAITHLIASQTTISLLLAVPGILATVVLAPILVPFLYSSAFLDVPQILDWQMFGVLFRVAYWPLGIALAARGLKVAFLVSDLATNAGLVLLIYFAAPHLGLPGLGAASSLSALFYLILVTSICRVKLGYRWSQENLVIFLAAVASLTLALLAIRLLDPPGLGRLVAAALGLALSAFCAHRLWHLAGRPTWTDMLNRVSSKLRPVRKS